MMTKAWIVRAVDSGNIQRSPTFQAIFNYYYSGSDRLPFPVIFDSAGIDVEKILANRTPVTRKLEIIDAGRHYDILSGNNKRLARELLGAWLTADEAQIPENVKEQITALYSDVKNDVHTLQMGFRNQALREAGIPDRCLPGMRTAFRHEENLRLILPVEDSVMNKLEQYYQPFHEKRPVIRIFGDLAGQSPLEDELAGGMETARRQVEYFMGTRDKAIRGIMSLLSEEAGR